MALIPYGCNDKACRERSDQAIHIKNAPRTGLCLEIEAVHGVIDGVDAENKNDELN